MPSRSAKEAMRGGAARGVEGGADGWIGQSWIVDGDLCHARRGGRLPMVIILIASRGRACATAATAQHRRLRLLHGPAIPLDSHLHTYANLIGGIYNDDAFNDGMDLSAANMKPERDGDTPSLSRTKRKHEEAASTKDGLCLAVPDRSTPQAAHGCSAADRSLGAPPGFHPKPPHSPVADTNDGDSAGWQAARRR
ncbi:hypothetical protein ZWY2020_037664 [Hordeum vulgare]|nr:hypothetical protein ZWY2020_037664 [Hordeum vulgare]